MGDAELMQLRLKANNGERLTTVEEWQLEMDFASNMIRSEHDYEQYQSGNLEYLQVVGFRRMLERWPYMGRMWPNYKQAFSPEFVDFMEDNVFNVNE